MRLLPSGTAASLRRFLATLAVLASSSAVLAQGAWPEKPITMVVPFPPGGVADTVARPVAEALSRELQGRGYQVLTVVEQTAQGRLATVRLQPPGRSPRGVVIDLLFASSGIERSCFIIPKRPDDAMLRRK